VQADFISNQFMQMIIYPGRETGKKCKEAGICGPVCKKY